MKKHLDTIYFIVIFSCFQLVPVYYTVFGLGPYALLALLLSTIAFLLWKSYPLQWKGRKPIPKMKPTPKGIVIVVLILLNVIDLIRHMDIIPRNASNRNLMIITLILICIAIKKTSCMRDNALFLLSVLNTISLVDILINNVILEKPIFFMGYSFACSSTIAWLVFDVIIALLGFCLDSDQKASKVKKYWYIFHFFAASFLLLLQKQSLSIGIVLFVFVLFMYVYADSVDKLKGLLFLCFGFLFLLSNMSLLVDYVPFIHTQALFNLNTSVYLELFIALVALVICSIWDRWEKRGVSEDKIGGYIRKFIRTTLLFLILLAIPFQGGGYQVFSEVVAEKYWYIQVEWGDCWAFWIKILRETNFVNWVSAAYLAFLLLYKVIKWYRKDQKDIPTRLLMLVGIVYFLQTLCLRQSLGIFLAYGMLVLSGTDGTEEKQGENIWEKVLG